jgi:PTH1 family peptidyl-tRNA hydrolase
MYLIVGLGNPGAEYQRTPHNLGFLTIDRLARDGGIHVGRPECRSLVGLGRIEGREVVLAKPLSYMNLSGGPVKALVEKYGLGLGSVMVIYDELNLPWGTLRVRERGSAGGHNGMESVIRALGSQEFLRVRIGIAPGYKVEDGAEFVLRPFRRSQDTEVEEIVGRAADAVRSILAEGAAKAMTKWNRRAGGQNNEEK